MNKKITYCVLFVFILIADCVFSQTESTAETKKIQYLENCLFKGARPKNYRIDIDTSRSDYRSYSWMVHPSLIKYYLSQTFVKLGYIISDCSEGDCTYYNCLKKVVINTEEGIDSLLVKMEWYLDPKQSFALKKCNNISNISEGKVQPITINQNQSISKSNTQIKGFGEMISKGIKPTDSNVEFKYDDSFRHLNWEVPLIKAYEYSDEVFDKLGYETFPSDYADNRRVYKNCKLAVVVEVGVCQFNSQRICISMSWFDTVQRKNAKYFLLCQ